MPNLLQKFSLDLPDLWELSPIRLESDPANDWRLLLRLFQPDDVVWIGDVHDSGPGKGRHFQTVEKWLAYPMAPGNFTCPAIFKNNVESRSSLNVIARPFLVVESDTLTKPEMCAVFNWLRPIMRLRAVVDTAGKSLHAWFDFPPKEALVELENVLPAMGCDKALFKPSQPCRLPGAARADKGGKIQSPCFLDLQK